MARQPADRYTSPRELANDIEAWTADEPVSACRETRGQRIARWTRHHRTSTRATALSGVVIAVVMIGEFCRSTNIARRRCFRPRRPKLPAIRSRRSISSCSIGLAKGAVCRQRRLDVEGIEKLTEAAAIPTQGRNVAELRTEVATCLAGVDLRPVRELVDDVHPRPLAFSPDGRRLAGGHDRSLGGCFGQYLRRRFGKKDRCLPFPGVVLRHFHHQEARRASVRLRLVPMENCSWWDQGTASFTPGIRPLDRPNIILGPRTKRKSAASCYPVETGLGWFPRIG